MLQSLFGSKEGGANDTSTLSTPSPNGEQHNQKKATSSYETGYQDCVARDSPQMHHHSDVDFRSNGSLSNMNVMGSGSRENPGSIRSRLVDQFQSSLNTTIANSTREACKHWDSQIRHLESNYQSVLEERNNLKSGNRTLTSKVTALEEKIKTLKTELHSKVILLRELQSDHLKTPGSRKLAPSSSAISKGFEDLERSIKDIVFARLGRLNIEDPCIQALSGHQPFLEAINAIMIEGISPSFCEAAKESERKGLLLWAIRGVIHDVLNKKIMKIHMPGLNISELQVMEKILDIISLSEECQGIKSAHEWRAETYRRLAYWAENVEELDKHTGDLAALGEVRQIFNDLIDGTKKEITIILEPLCDKSSKGSYFSSLIMNIVDRAFQFSILIGSQTARYELYRNADKKDYFEVVPDHFSGSADTANNWSMQLFYTVPALVKTSSEDGEVYDVPELLVNGKIYALFISSDPATEERVSPDAAENTTMQPSSTNRGDLEGQDVGAITSQNGLNGALNETHYIRVTPGPRSPTMDSSKKPSCADTLQNESNQSVTEFSEIIPEQEPIVKPTYKNIIGSGSQTPRNEPNGVAATTASGSSENDMGSQLSSGVQGARHQGESTKANQMITRPGILELQFQATRKSQNEPLEDLSSGGHSPHPTEVQALSTPSNTPSTTEQATLPDPGETEPTPSQVQTQDKTTPVSHTTPAASEAEETSHPQILFEIQLQPSPELPISSISQSQELTSQRETEHEQLNSLTDSDGGWGRKNSTHGRRANQTKKQRKKQKYFSYGNKLGRKGRRH
ncbi:hypothetical protein TWF106_006424 [Orbilia oligospora]|uniref:Uncharacterized protein n=1 Tax=Orbilia oligospora TaxID=2813651 RepID=A0A7C8UT13_ORBOL|nr:hypothetical protein TWF106_006424 [Orbilia oligospora]